MGVKFGMGEMISHLSVQCVDPEGRKASKLLLSLE